MNITLQFLLDNICLYYSIEPELLFSMSRERWLVEKRMMFFHLAKEFVPVPLLTIMDFVNKIGRKDPLHHATIIHAQKTFTNLILYNPKLRQDLQELTDKIKGLESTVVQEVDLLSICQRNSLKTFLK